ncbi:hypothetical protein JCM10207_007718 [Rhodosporidiobolus poonsookiae]
MSTTLTLAEPERSHILLALRRLICMMTLISRPPAESVVAQRTTPTDKTWQLFSSWAFSVFGWASRYLCSDSRAMSILRPVFLEALYLSAVHHLAPRPSRAVVNAKAERIRRMISETALTAELTEDAIGTLSLLLAPF